ncbi:hypothetical protein BWI15_04210 [Kribbella sp. ALI-6-A]|uniref:hypothetical protein n=1 Tax=Kribbella sp. ALI-6-A TaxID=1933817 RepID=UPI00097C4AA1|nr:hypothetical protein [Kribbella sp. ALI-6-A]ONI76520.1 hypothetical protein BWI15_04210 [Kribbella sp. ALI-6-A]
MTPLDHRNPPTDLWSGPAADLAAAAGASFAPAPAAEPARRQLPTDRIAPAPFDELIDTEPSRHVAAAHATSYGVEQLPHDYAYYPPTDGAHSARGSRAQRDTRTSSTGGRRSAAPRDRAPATATGSSGDHGGGRNGRRGTGGQDGRPKRSHAAVGAAVVAVTAVIGTLAFVLTNGSSPEAGSGTGTSRDSVAPSAPGGNDPAPAAPSTAKNGRKPAVPSSETSTTTSTTPNTGPESPTFRAGQWIVVLDTYPTDAGMAADQLAKSLAGKLINSGVPARALRASGQYPGLADAGGDPMTDTWIVYLGPATSSAAAVNACSSPKVQKVHANNACPSYEPAVRP